MLNGAGRPDDSAGIVMVAMSGGVDSSVAAALLARAGRRVVGVSLRLHDASEQGGAGRCCSPEDFRDARLVAGRMGFPYYVLDYEGEFRKTVLSRFVEEYRAGRTPSPCVSCNTDLKFGALMRHAEQLGAEWIATGHYARVRRDPSGVVALHRAVDREKDQSYFLFDLDQEQLGRAEFPLGELTKSEVREIARKIGLEVADKPESQDICFVPDGDYRAVLEREADLGAAGDVVHRDGRVLGQHGGIAGFTVGQRRGIGAAISSTARGSTGGEKLYVLGMDADTGRVVVGPDRELMSGGLVASRWRWLSGLAPEGPVRGSARIRYRHPGAEATVNDDGHRVTVVFDEPQRAITPGQAVVLYDGSEVLGGGWIDGSLDAAPARETVSRRVS